MARKYWANTVDLSIYRVNNALKCKEYNLLDLCDKYKGIYSSNCLNFIRAYYFYNKSVKNHFNYNKVNVKYFCILCETFDQFCIKNKIDFETMKKIWIFVNYRRKNGTISFKIKKLKTKFKYILCYNLLSNKINIEDNFII